MTNSLEKDLFQEIVITDYEQAMAGFLFLTQKIKTVVQEKLAIGNNNVGSSIDNITYSVIMIGVWLVVFFLIWLSIFILYKTIRLVV
uniref:Plectrovirus SVGII3 orf 10 transmembrane protein n=1 Tax=Spiroplasma citri TaxID=2133 RepID=Q14M21_SPICI|nr:plectrovirus SVGII3 orf 10 transmembrane protein [Spiroplasma citri]